MTNMSLYYESSLGGMGKGEHSGQKRATFTDTSLAYIFNVPYHIPQIQLKPK
jgi:hypothetical protein